MLGGLGIGVVSLAEGLYAGIGEGQFNPSSASLLVKGGIILLIVLVIVR
jgi:hypothetical protein